MSVFVTVTFFPVPEHRKEVIEAFKVAIPKVHQEPGVELYALYEGSDRLVMIEKYESDEARAEHLNGAALAELRIALQGKVEPGRDIQVLVSHPAGDPVKGAV